MSCGSEFETESFITDTLLAIVEAQDRVDSGVGGPVGCNRAIQELIGGINPSGFNTIPVILTLKSTGLPFMGYGAIRENVSPSTSAFIYSAVFRVEEVDPDTGAASLELLTRANVIPYLGDTAITPNAALFDLNNEVLTGTDSFINVDLSSILAVTCLPPTTIL